MSTINEVPTQPSAQRYFLTLAGVSYRLTFTWNNPANVWILDIGDVNDVPIRSGIPLVTGADLMEQFEYLGMNTALIVQSDDNVDAVPTFANLGTISHLYAITALSPISEHRPV